MRHLSITHLSSGLATHVHALVEGCLSSLNGDWFCIATYLLLCSCMVVAVDIFGVIGLSISSYVFGLCHWDYVVFISISGIYTSYPFCL